MFSNNKRLSFKIAHQIHVSLLNMEKFIKKKEVEEKKKHEYIKKDKNS